MGRKTPQGRAGKLIRPLTNRITNRFTNRDGLRLTTANLVVSNCSDESDQTKGKSPAIHALCNSINGLTVRDCSTVKPLDSSERRTKQRVDRQTYLTHESVLSNHFSEIPKRRMAFASYR